MHPKEFKQALHTCRGRFLPFPGADKWQWGVRKSRHASALIRCGGWGLGWAVTEARVYFLARFALYF